jgi:hypothetical protein
MNGFKPNVKMSMKKAMGGTVQARPNGSSPRPGEKPFSSGMSRPSTNMPLVKNPPNGKPMGKPMGKPGVKMAMGGNAAKFKPHKLRPGEVGNLPAEAGAYRQELLTKAKKIRPPGEVTNKPPRFDGVGDGPRRPPTSSGMGNPMKLNIFQKIKKGTVDYPVKPNTGGPRRPPIGGGMDSPVNLLGGGGGGGMMGGFGPRNPNGPRKPIGSPSPMSGGIMAGMNSLFKGPMARKKGGMAKGMK